MKDANLFIPYTIYCILYILYIYIYYILSSIYHLLYTINYEPFCLCGILGTQSKVQSESSVLPAGIVASVSQADLPSRPYLTGSINWGSFWWVSLQEPYYLGSVFGPPKRGPILESGRGSNKKSPWGYPRPTETSSKIPPPPNYITHSSETGDSLEIYTK